MFRKGLNRFDSISALFFFIDVIVARASLSCKLCFFIIGYVDFGFLVRRLRLLSYSLLRQFYSVVSVYERKTPRKKGGDSNGSADDTPDFS